jgi:hypothetical protein
MRAQFGPEAGCGRAAPDAVRHPVVEFGVDIPGARQLASVSGQEVTLIQLIGSFIVYFHPILKACSSVRHISKKLR